MKKISVIAVAGLIVFAVSLAIAAEQPSVELGKKLFNDTKLGTNEQSCASCHTDNQNIKKETAGHPDDADLAKVINTCIKGALKGKPLAEDSVDMKSLVMYMRSVK